MIEFFKDPFFWAMISMFGFVGATSMFSKHKYTNNIIFVSLSLLFVTVGRIILVLPFCPQPRFDIGEIHLFLGGLLLVIGFGIVLIPTFIVKWWSPPKEDMKLRTTGIYGLIRHPIYFFEVVWFLALSIIFRSTYGLALSPIWWLVFLIHTLSEEAELERVLGDEYLQYKKKVRGRMFPGLPF